MVTPDISISPSEESVQTGDLVTLTGSIDPFVEATEILIEVKSPLTTKTFSVTTTDGDFTHQLEAEAEGTWEVKARVPGGEVYRGAESEKVIISAQSVEEPDPPDEKQCIIATVTFGSESEPEVDALRGFRDDVILSTYTGSSFYVALTPSTTPGAPP